jgi:hypothetical protein
VLGAVFRACEPAQLDKLVAVKLFQIDLPPDRVHVLVGELERVIGAGLAHPSMAAPIAAGISGVSAYLAQEFVGGESLDVGLRNREPMPLAQAVRITSDVAAALDAAAAVDVTHGALHPRDVLVSLDHARLTGLGVARALERAGAVVPVRRPYAAPERTAAGADWDRRADVFSLAALAHEMLWARRVSAGGAEAAGALTEVAGADLTALRGLFARALAPNPDDRFESAGSFAEQLRQACVSVPAAPRPFVRRGPRARAAESRMALVEMRPPVEREPRLPLDPLPQESDLVAAAPAASEDAPGADAAVESDASVAPPPQPPAFSEIPQRPTLLARRRSDREHVSSPVLQPERTVASTAILEGRLGLMPLALTAVVFLAVGFAAGYGMASREWPTEPGVALSAEPLAAQPGTNMAVTQAVGAAPVAAPARTPAASAPVAAPVSEPAAASLKPEAGPTPAVGSPNVVPATPKPVPAARAAVPAKPVEGQLVVRSTPAGARVLVDGRDRGQTPLTLRNVSLGSHAIRVIRDGYAIEERRLSITAARPSQSVTVALARERPAAPAPKPVAAATASLQIDSRPAGANVFIDGRLVGKTPAHVEDVSAGTHVVRLELAGYSQWTASVPVEAGGRQRVAASLELTGARD